MPPLALVVPIALPIAASLIAAASGRFGWHLGRVPAAAGSLAALIALLSIWIPIRSTLDIPIGALGFGANLDLRLDAVGLAFGLLILGPASVLLCLQPRTWRESTVASLGVAAAVLLIESRGALLTALAGSTAATLALIQLEMEDVEAPRPAWAVVLAPWLAMAWVGVILLVQGGTADYDSVPVAALTTPVLLLVAMAAVMASGLYPWRSWAARLWARPSLRATGIMIATVQPLGVYLLVRAYEMGDGRYPNSTLNVALVAWGVLVALGAAVRAQAATTRREYMSEVLPGLAGFALMSVAVGSALGVVAAVILLTAAAVTTTCLPLLPQKRGAASFFVVAAAAGVPPSLAFGGRLRGWRCDRADRRRRRRDMAGLCGRRGAVDRAAAWPGPPAGGGGPSRCRRPWGDLDRGRPWTGGGRAASGLCCGGRHCPARRRIAGRRPLRLHRFDGCGRCGSPWPAARAWHRRARPVPAVSTRRGCR